MDADRAAEKYLGGGGARPVGPRGLRNKNPGNIRTTSVKWQGQIGDDGDFCIFSSDFYGLRALAKVIETYHDRYGLCTVRTIINRWAPPVENNTSAYVSAVCQTSGFGADDWLHVGDDTVMLGLVKGIVRHENGEQPYSDADILNAIHAL